MTLCLQHAVTDQIPGYFDEAFPTKLVWLSSVFYFIGGGHRVLVSMLLSMLTDIIGPSRR